MTSYDLGDLVEAALKSMHPAHSNVFLGCATSVLVIDGGVLAQDMEVANSINLIAVVAVLVSVFMEPERKSALGILLHFFGRKGNTVKRGKEATDVMGRIGTVDMAH